MGDGRGVGVSATRIARKGLAGPRAAARPPRETRSTHRGRPVVYEGSVRTPRSGAEAAVRGTRSGPPTAADETIATIASGRRSSGAPQGTSRARVSGYVYHFASPDDDACEARTPRVHTLRAAVLLSLQVRDLAIIDATEVSFGSGLNVVTGETGAGKSILIDALLLALGGRGTPEMVRAGAAHAEVCALFDLRALPDVRARLLDAGIECDDEVTVRRVVASERSGGRSRAYLNGRLVSLSQLAQLTAGLGDVTSQHEAQSLTDPNTHLALLDATARLDGLRGEVSAAQESFRLSTTELESLLRELRQRTDREDLLRFQRKEIEDLPLTLGDEGRWSSERDRLKHATRLSEGAAEAEDVLYARDGAVVDQLGQVRGLLEELTRLDPALSTVAELVDGAKAQVDEAARALGRYGRTVHADPEQLSDLEDRLQKLSRLKRKYGGSVEAILEHHRRVVSELDNLEQGESRIAELERRVEQARSAAATIARKLSHARRDAAAALGDAISRELTSLGMGGARVVVDVTPTSPASGELAIDGVRLLPTGIDRVEFLIAANKGEEPRSLRRIASGGELSRALLAIKRVLTEVGSAGLYVFDEVDTGVGGAVAEVIGQKLRAISRRNQTLVITHLPQIAAYADRHYVVAKRVEGERTVSEVRALNESERTEEIARMLGGLRVTDRTRAAAAEMIRTAASA
jgi:DNA repair protein RecN (Recombination protein N)